MKIDWTDAWFIESIDSLFKVGNKVRLLRSIKVHRYLEDITWKTFWKFFKSLKQAEKTLPIGTIGEVVRVDTPSTYVIKFKDSTVVYSMHDYYLEKVEE